VKVEPGQRRHDDDEPDDPGYGERHYTVLGRETLGARDGWAIRYEDGLVAWAPDNMIMRDTLLAPQDVGKVGP
jgi:hypothetical protein